MVSLCGWERVMFGSECLVIFWRDETYSSCVDWMRRINPSVSKSDLEGFLGKTANELLFASSGPNIEAVDIPRWVSDQFDRTRTVPLWNNKEVSMAAIRDELESYITELVSRPATSFSERSKKKI